jgi:hypothetical protein
LPTSELKKFGDASEGSRVTFSDSSCEAIVTSPDIKAKAISYRPRRAALNWVDYLVIAATALTFAAVVAANNPHAARAQTRASLIPAAELPTQLAQVTEQPGMIKAKIGLALAAR